MTLKQHSAATWTCSDVFCILLLRILSDPFLLAATISSKLTPKSDIVSMIWWHETFDTIVITNLMLFMFLSRSTYERSNDFQLKWHNLLELEFIRSDASQRLSCPTYSGLECFIFIYLHEYVHTWSSRVILKSRNWHWQIERDSRVQRLSRNRIKERKQVLP